MKVVRDLYRLIGGTLLFTLAMVFTQAAEAQTIHAVLVMMNDDPLTRELNETNLVRVHSHLEEIKEELGCNLTVESLYPLHTDDEHHATRSGRSGRHATRENILEWLAAARPEPEDVVLVYYSGDGGTDKETRELFLTLQDGDFPRQQLAEAVESVPCRLKLLITDIFSFDTPLWTSFHPYVHTTEAYRSLFLEHEGFLNITSAGEGELSGGTAGSWSGCSWFTRALLGAMTEHPDSDGDGFVSWKEVFKSAQGRTGGLFAFASRHFSEGLKRKLARIGQESQSPKYYGQLPRRIDTAAPLPLETQTLHALFVIMDVDSSYLVGMEAIQGLLEDVVETVNCDFNEAHLFASQQEMTSGHIQQWLQAVRPAPNDVVFVYYNGHGHAGEGQELYLDLLDDANFPRKAIAASVQNLGCRLKILVTDSSSHRTPVTEPLDVFGSLYRAEVKNASLSREEVYRHLFFEHEGFLNLTAATEGERAFGDSEGGWFTRAFVHALYEFTSLDSNSDSFVSWSEAFQRICQKTMTVFYEWAPRGSDELKQTLRAEGIRSQRPKYYGELPKRIAP